MTILLFWNIVFSYFTLLTYAKSAVHLTGPMKIRHLLHGDTFLSRLSSPVKNKFRAATTGRNLEAEWETGGGGEHRTFVEALRRDDTPVPKVENVESMQAAPIIHPAATTDRLYIAVLTTPRSLARRTAVRNTWKKEADRKPRKFTVVFFLCIHGVEKTDLQELQQENAQYHDIEMLECFEGYEHGNLTHKVFAAMQRFNEDNTKIKEKVAFMKTDDDTLVFPDKIMQIVEQTSSRAENYYIGLYLGANIKPFRDSTNKWYEPIEVWPRNFPAAMSGAGYILNAMLIHRWCTEDLREVRNRMLWNEDRAVGVWVEFESFQKKTPVMFVRLNGYDSNSLELSEQFKRGGLVLSSLSLLHKLEPAQMTCAWEARKRSNAITTCLT